VFANPEGLIAWINSPDADARVRPDQKVVVRRDWENIDARLRGTKALLETLVKIATKQPVTA
jgi:transcription-repair coupling factor (superfamily II helicase)